MVLPFSEVKEMIFSYSGFKKAGWAFDTHGDGSLLPEPLLDQVLLGRQFEAISEEPHVMSL